MPDNPRKKRLDRRLLSIKQAHELRYWTKSLGVTAERLRYAVGHAGHSVNAVRVYMRADRWAKG